jgi:hypothetical protein
MMDYSGNIVCDAAVRGPKLILNELQFLTTDLADLTHDCNFHQVLTSHVVVSSVNASLSGYVQLRKTAPIDFMTLAGRWMIAPDHAKKTVQRTTQRGVRICLNSMLARRFPTNDRMLLYKLLLHTTFTNMLFAGTPSRSGNKCAQAYSMSFGWAREHPMTRKGEAHETLSLFSIVTVFLQPWYLTARMSNAKVTLKENCVSQIATLDRLNPTPRGSRPLRVVFAN